MIHIAQDGTGDFSSVSEALASLPKDNSTPLTLYIHKGFYEEQITINVPYITFLGESQEDTVLSYGLYARMAGPDGENLGTFRTYSCLIDTHDFTAKNITFQNSSGKGVDVGQALALYADGDRLIFENCRFLSGQDTLFTGPLPPKELQKNSFLRELTGGSYIKTVIWKEILTLFSAAPPLILKVAPSFPNTPEKRSAVT